MQQETFWSIGPKAHLLVQRASSVLVPGSQSYLNVFPEEQYPRFIERGEGPYIYDVDGKQYIDLFLGSGTILLGHGNKEQLAKVYRQFQNGASVSLRHPIEIEIAEWFKSHIPSSDRTMFFKTGSEAAHTALRLALQSRQRSKALSLGYHGWLPPFRNGWPKTYDIQVIEGTWDLETVVDTIQKHKTDLGAVIISPNPSMLAKDFYTTIEAETHRIGAVLIMDEIKSGFRFKFPCLSVAYGLDPDIILLSKAISNGFPVTVLTGKDTFLGDPYRIDLFSSFSSETLSLFAMQAAIELLQNGLYAGFEHAAHALYEGLREILPGHMASIIGEPTFFRIEFREEGLAETFARKLAYAGILYHPYDEVLISAAHDREDVLKKILSTIKHIIQAL